MKKGHKDMYCEMVGHLRKKLYKKGGLAKKDPAVDSAKALAAEPSPSLEHLEEDDVEVMPKKKREKKSIVIGIS